MCGSDEKLSAASDFSGGVSKPEVLAFDSLSSRSIDWERNAVKKVIGYTRVSTEEQGRSGLGLEAQRAAIRAQATAHGWDVEWIEDSGESASSLKRPGMLEALDLLKRGDADAIVIAKLDRLSRSVQDFAQVLDTAKRQRWAVIALDLGVDTTTTTGRLVANIMAAVAQWEREIISDRTSLALKAAQSKGIHVGRRSSLDKDTELRLLELRAQGYSHSKIAVQLNAERVPTAHGGAQWYTTTVARILKRTGQEAAA